MITLLMADRDAELLLNALQHHIDSLDRPQGAAIRASFIALYEAVTTQINPRVVSDSAHATYASFKQGSAP